ncbi:phenylacetate--CoA ligase PaaK [Paremcibacter congregatus]|uniref:Phenylacetate-coenzyme A ligase n=1 Tax=Paremcibacter congregatus TaxID=2043170 RepID=A0A2G4YQN2_9PROT|nr:phenylacetate--CoA ligase PaaK [Paremcibacter congregatus]PHZ84643.1 phenylacetate--CoA ligase [Paremcibacter congregatus]QDE28680.1 phenylacetate--CoA ligase [Paremcibacter congregatus]
MTMFSGINGFEKSSRNEIEAVQLERMKWSLKHAYDNVPFYRTSFDAAGVHPDDLTCLADLSKFPFTVKKDLRDNYPFGLFAVPQEKLSRIHASSGTTGKPTVVGYTAQDIDVWAEAVARCIRAAGGREGDMVHVAFGYGLFTGGLGAHYGAERAGCTVVPASGGATESQITIIQDFKPRIIMVTPSYMLSLADSFEKMGLDPRETSLEIAIHGAEPWTEEMRKEIEQRFDLKAVDIYGLSEVMGPGVGAEYAETQDGLTIWEDLFYPEVIDPETGEVLPDGEEGELVFTSLCKEAFPIIRYRTRDLTRLLPGSVSEMRRISRIFGRSDDMMIIRGVNVFPTQIEEIICKDDRLTPHYFCEIRRPHVMDELTVVTEAKPEFSDDHNRSHIAEELKKHIKNLCGVSTKVDVREPNGIPRSVGKAQRVFDFRHLK